jgi:hypothetical protein
MPNLGTGLGATSGVITAAGDAAVTTLQVGDCVEILRATHPFFGQTGEVLTIFATFANVDYNGDGLQDNGGAIGFAGEGVGWRRVACPAPIILPAPDPDPDPVVVAPEVPEDEEPAAEPEPTEDIEDVYTV